ncbi:MAG: competence/damage-inducible protein A [Methermicoccaceae archaeon]
MICIGDELLRGDTINTNATYIAQKLTEKGVRVARILVIGDDKIEIANTIKNSEERILILTGGLGPTPDDITREGVVIATGDELHINHEILNNMMKEYGLHHVQEIDEQMAVMAKLPSRAVPISNPVGVAPGFLVETAKQKIFVLPGVPSEMKAMMNDVLSYIEEGAVQDVRWINTSLPEPSISGLLYDMITLFPNVSIGSYPHGSLVRIRLSSTNEEELGSAFDWLSSKLQLLEGTLGSADRVQKGDGKSEDWNARP